VRLHLRPARVVPEEGDQVDVNLAELRDTLAAHGYGDDTADAQTLLINSAYRDVALERRWPWLQQQATLQLDAGSSALDLSSVSDLRDVDAVRVPGHSDPDFRDLQELRSYASQDNLSLGLPSLWSLAKPRTIAVYPAADRSYTVVVDYIMTISPLVSDGDIPVLPVEHHDVLVYGAIARMGIRERDADVRQLMMADYERALNKLRASHSVRQRQSTTQVKRSGLYDV
jgi:hypothetical protein